MRVAYFVAEYKTYAGSHASLAATMASLRDHGIETLVLVPGEGRAADMFRTQGWEVDVLPTPTELNVFQRGLLRLSWAHKAWLALTNVLPYSFAVWRWLRRRDVDVLHCNSTRAVLLAGAVPRLAGVPVLLHGRAKQVDRGMLWWLAQCIASRVIVVASHLVSEGHRRFRHKFTVVRNAVDEDAVRRLSRDEARLPAALLDRIRSAPARILTLASLDPRKGIHALVQAAALVNEGLTLRPLFLVAGTIEKDLVYTEYVRGLARDLSVDNFVLTGWLANPYPLLRVADVVVVPSLEDVRGVPSDNPRDPAVGEGMPRVILEAMALGKAVVASAVSGSDEALGSEDAGVLVAPGSAPELARAMIHLLSDAQARAELGRAARARAAVLFTPGRHAELLLDIYRQVGVAA